MKTISSNLISALIAVTLAPALFATDLSDTEKQFLARYEQVRAALAADDLNAAKKAAAELGDEGSALAASDKITTARAEFAKLSEHAIKLAKGQGDFYVVYCPMLRKEWVQPKLEISNPYAGRSMPNCGAIRK